MEIFAVFGLLCSIPAILVGGALWRAFVGVKLWLWFVVPQFGLAPIPIVTAIGLSVLVGMYSGSSAQPKDPEEPPAQAFGKSVARVILFPAFGLLFGWCIHQFQ